MEFTDAVALVRFRAQAMQDAVPANRGAMAAILGLDDNLVRSVCEQASGANEIVEAANFNSPAQVVIAGNRSAVERAMKIAGDNGAKRAIMLPMSVPSHCSLMRPAAELLRDRLKTVKVGKSEIPVLHNADVKSTESADAVCDALVRQLYQPVRWVDTVRAILSTGVTDIVECGPGKVLAGLNKRIAPGVKTYSFADEPAFSEALSALK